VSITLIGKLVEMPDTFLVLDGNTHVMLPPGLRVKDLVVSECLTITVTRKSGRWTAERIQRGPV
jgi:hypothetical protein